MTVKFGKLEAGLIAVAIAGSEAGQLDLKRRWPRRGPEAVASSAAVAVAVLAESGSPWHCAAARLTNKRWLSEHR